jgi:membrane protease YdiL (CAAX protease family)
MKKCPYCGKEYPDDATNCAIDNESLWDASPQSATVEKEEIKTPPKKDEPYLLFPDYKWSARDAWKCIGIIICLSIVLEAIDYIAYLNFPIFFGSGWGFACRRILFFTTWVLPACYFARTETLASVWDAFGLNRKPTNLVWFGVTAAVLLRLVSQFVLIHGWSKGVNNYEFTSFRNTIGYERWLFKLSPVILAPIFEESVNRGFLYKAFRGSYSVGASTLFVLVWVCYTHWSYYSVSWIAALNLSALTIVQCYLREKSASLWDCILCHFAFNASSLFVSGALR